MSYLDQSFLWMASRNPARFQQLRLVVYPIIYRGFCIPGGWPWDFWTINSMKNNGCSKDMWDMWQDCQSLRWLRSCYLHAVACQLSGFLMTWHMWFMSWFVVNNFDLFPKDWKGIQVPVFFGGTHCWRQWDKKQASASCFDFETLSCGWIEHFNKQIS